MHGTQTSVETEIRFHRAGRTSIEAFDSEMVERKGMGHPDTLADGIADAISRAYSKYTLSEFGFIANHWVDKCVLMGGQSEFGFGFGRMISPIQVYVFGKATERIGTKVVPLHSIFTQATREYLAPILPLLKPDVDLQVIVKTNDYRGAGRPLSWYKPTEAVHNSPPTQSNDSVICTAYWPLSALEEVVLAIESMFSDDHYRKDHPDIGTDIKVIGRREGRNISMIVQVPFVSSQTPSRKHYEERKLELMEQVHARWPTIGKVGRLGYSLAKVRMNTRDTSETVYMSHLGGCMDTGDIGVVGRGNKANGVISPFREMCVEAPSGKNPVYHAGKIYTALAQEIASLVNRETGAESYVTILTETGRPIEKPTAVVVRMTDDELRYSASLQTKVADMIAGARGLTESFVQGTA